MITVLGLPFDENSSYLKGPALAPAAIRKIWNSGSSNNFSENLTDLTDHSIWNDRGDLRKETQTIESYFELISESVADIALKGDKPLCLGGDHSLSFPIIRGLARADKPFHILHLDAHPDLYENFEDNTFSHASPFARIMENKLALSLTQIGLRTINAHQKAQAEKFSVNQFTVTSWSLEKVHNLKGPLYISIDIDSLDPAFAPGVSHLEPGGLSTRELIQIIQAVNTEVIGADIVELNPARDVNDMTATVAYKIMKELLAKMNGL